MTRLDDIASKDITADQITGEDAPAPAPGPARLGQIHRAARPRRRVAAARYIARRPLKSAVVIASVIAIAAKGAPLLVPLFVRLSR